MHYRFIWLLNGLMTSTLQCPLCQVTLSVIIILITREMCSRIDMQTHDGRLSRFPFRANCNRRLRLGLGFDLLPFDVRVSACRGHAMSTDFDADSSSRFSVRARTNRQIDATERPAYAGGYTAGFDNNNNIKISPIRD